MDDWFCNLAENTVNIDEIFDQANRNSLELELSETISSSMNESSEYYSLGTILDINSRDETNLLEDIFRTGGPPQKKRRGRRPLRPQDPIRKKTEEKDKYWLRAFRAYMRTSYGKLREEMETKEVEFWDFYLGIKGKPGRGNEFLSYGKQYKAFLFSTPTFTMYFQKWFTEHGEKELRKKCEPGTERWFVFYDYAARDLYSYNNDSPVKQDYSDSSYVLPPIAVWNQADEYMITDSTDDIQDLH